MVNLDNIETQTIEFTKQWLLSHRAWNYGHWNSDLAATPIFPGNGDFATSFKKQIWKYTLGTFARGSDDVLSKRASVALLALKDTRDPTKLQDPAKSNVNNLFIGTIAGGQVQISQGTIGPSQKKRSRSESPTSTSSAKICRRRVETNNPFVSDQKSPLPPSGNNNKQDVQLPPPPYLACSIESQSSTTSIPISAPSPDEGFQHPEHQDQKHPDRYTSPPPAGLFAEFDAIDSSEDEDGLYPATQELPSAPASSSSASPSPSTPTEGNIDGLPQLLSKAPALVSSTSSSAPSSSGFPSVPAPPTDAAVDTLEQLRSKYQKAKAHRKAAEEHIQAALAYEDSIFSILFQDQLVDRHDVQNCLYIS